MHAILSWRYVSSILAALIVLLNGLGQSPLRAQDTPDVADESIATVAAEHPSDDLTPTPPAPGPFQRVDSVFAKAVADIEEVLFYRLATREREYVQIDREIHFVRDRGTDEPFTRLEVTNGHLPDQLTPDDVALYSARGSIVAGDVVNGEQQPYQLGSLGERPVEFVTLRDSVTIDPASTSNDAEPIVLKHGSKLVRRSVSGSAAQFHLVEPPRGVVSDTKYLSAVQVEDLAARGWLETDGTGDEDYLLTESTGGIPVVVAWLAAGAIFFTLYMSGFNIWGFRHAIDIVRGKYDNPDEAGEVTHFQALASALSATIGLGNIAGVAIAMTIGGPGAFFWMLLCGLFGMCSKFVECTLGQKYRTVKPDGTVLGGPMSYLSRGLAEMRLGWLGAILAVIFSVMCILASFGGGNMLQANQAGSAMLQMLQQDSLERISELRQSIRESAQQNDVETLRALQQEEDALADELRRFEFRFKAVYGVVLAALVAAVILGGIKRIGRAAEKIVPTMCLVYMAACLFIIIRHLDRVPSMIALIFNEAFSGVAMGGGILGVLVVGVQRAAFSNEAGAGSAAIAHSAAKTSEPIREGCVALLGPFIDTVVVCSMTALVILITGAWDNRAWIVEQELAGAALTSRAFKEEISWFPYVLSAAVTLFAYSTIISWSYYGERAWEYLFGARTTSIYKTLAVICVFVGTIVNLGSVIDFSDMMILGMAFPNIAGVVLLAPKVRRDLFKYWSRYRAGEFPTYK
ncbi:Sodium/alanine symporter AgcS (Alanine permease) [Durusdinium trenchii]|uniref:Sodium/alanine symporter AgcS (Alanine permease) n=1 Tax=Durusdinium trenchii TaxID=1381693 RepID=A0ABP0STB6_9DINO